MGEEGMVNMAVQEFTKVRMKKAEKEERERELRALSDTGGPSGHQKLQVCDVCGAYLSRLDNDRRLADHFYGKMHLGYAQMRKSYESLQKELKVASSTRCVNCKLHSPSWAAWKACHGRLCASHVAFFVRSD